MYSVQQLSNLIGKSKAVSTVYSSRLVKKGLAIRVMKGKISFVDDLFVIATQLVEPSYISLNSALLFHEVLQQIPKAIECATTKNSLKYNNVKAIYHKIPKSLFYGYKRYGKANSYIFVAEPEKAIIDGIYLNLYGKKDLDELAPKVSNTRLLELADRFDGRGSKKIRSMIK